MNAATSPYDREPPQMIEALGAALAVRTFGQGSDVLLVHGFPVHGYTWRHLLPELARHHRCRVVDLPGLGDSTWSDTADFRFGAQAERLAAALKQLGVARVSVVAHDTGATIARLLALAHPDAVTRLTLINTEIPRHRPPFIREFQIASYLPGARLTFRALLSLAAFRRSPMGLGGLFVDPALIDGDFHDRFIRPLVEDPRRVDGALRYLRGIDWNAVDSLEQRHRDITAKVQMLWGDEDPTFPVARAEAMRSQFARPPAFHRIHAARLMPHEEQPQQVLEHLLPFLANK
jgi:pimeloyl-ACP methyl ester carboxylesterase